MRYLVLLVLLFVAVPAFAQTQGIQGDSLAWDQPAEDLATARLFAYHVSLDGTPPVVLPATCSGTVSPFLCSAVLPTLANGTHTSTVFARLTLTDGRVLDSPVSALFTFQWLGRPGQPGNQRLLPAVPGGLVSPPPSAEPRLW